MSEDRVCEAVSRSRTHQSGVRFDLDVRPTDPDIVLSCNVTPLLQHRCYLWMDIEWSDHYVTQYFLINIKFEYGNFIGTIKNVFNNNIIKV